MEEPVEQYIKGCLQNDTRSQELLYRYCFTHLMKLCLRYHTSSDDAVASFNKAMHTVFDKLGTYRHDGVFLGWVRTVVVNTCLNDLRSVAKYGYSEISEKEEATHHTIPEVYSNISEKEILELVQQLPPSARTVFNLYVMEGYTHEKIGQALQIAPGTSKWQLHQARTWLKEKIILLSKKEEGIHAT